MAQLWQFLTRITYDYPDSVREQKANFVLRLVQILGAVAIFFGVFISVINLITGQSLIGLHIYFGIGAPLLGVAVVGLLQNGQERVAVLSIVVALLFGGLLTLSDGMGDITDVAIMTPVLVAALLMSWRETSLVWLVAILLIVQSAVLYPVIDASGTDITLLSVASLVATMTVLTLIVAIYTRQSEQAASGFEADAYRIRRITQTVSTLAIRTEERDVLERVMGVVQDVLNCAPVSFYFAGEEGGLVRRLRYGEIGEGENVSLGVVSAIAESARLKETVIVDLNSDATRRHHFEPGTIIGACVPVYHEDDLLGVLDVQSTQLENLRREDIMTLQALANLLYGTLYQVRLIRTMQDDIRDQQRIIGHQRERLRDLGERDKRLITQAWDEYLTGRRSDVLGFDIASYADSFTVADDLPEDIRMGLEAGEVIVKEGEEYQHISVPISIREQVVGAMSFRLSARRRASSYQIELLQNVVQRLGLALENRRLVEQSQLQAQRESRANEIGGLLLSTTDIESVLAIAAERFNQVLGAIQTQIHLQPQALEDETSMNGSSQEAEGK